MTKLKHRKPCNECPFRRQCINGYLGSSHPDEFLWVTLNDETDAMPCHKTIDYERSDWKEKQLPTAGACAGSLIFMKNQFKLPRNPVIAAMVNSVEQDTKNVFEWPNEFLTHHKTPFSERIKQEREKKREYA